MNCEINRKLEDRVKELEAKSSEDKASYDDLYADREMYREAARNWEDSWNVVSRQLAEIRKDYADVEAANIKLGKQLDETVKELDIERQSHRETEERLASYEKPTLDAAIDMIRQCGRSFTLTIHEPIKQGDE